MSVADSVVRLGIDPAEVAIVTLDGRQSHLCELLPANGRVCVFPPILGG